MSPEFEDRITAMEQRTRLLEGMTVAHMEAVRNAPIIAESREDAVLVRYAALASRVRGLEEGYHEVVNLVVEMFDMVKELHDERKRG